MAMEMAQRRTALALLFFVVLLPHSLADLIYNKQVYVVYMGSKLHDDPEITSSHNHQMLAAVHEGSLDATEESMIYSYKHGFRGFAAKLTADQADSLARMPGVLRVFRSKRNRLHTTRSWEFLGLPPSELGGIPHTSGSQENVILGLFDSGIWPESKSFSDDLMPPVPLRWKGECVAGENFTSSMCNRKLIGARFYMKGLQGEMGVVPTMGEGGSDYLSPRDSEGHGTHTASTAAGRFVPEISMQGLAKGGARGGAPTARIAAYKVCWSQGCFDADILAAFDDAIRDGVDVLSLSLGPDPPQNDYFNDAVSIGSFHAARKGISVICSVGNNGPQSAATNVAPWFITVAASSIDRDFPAYVTLGNNVTLKGESLVVEQMKGHSELIYAGDANMPTFTPLQSRYQFFFLPPIAATKIHYHAWFLALPVRVFHERACRIITSYCLNSSLDPAKVKNKIVVCQFPPDVKDSKLSKSRIVSAAGGAGIILIDEEDRIMGVPFVIPGIIVGNDAGRQILSYIRSTKLPTAFISPASTTIGFKPAPQVASFSSRGPSTVSPDILKPDITAPGLNILAAWSPAKMGLDFNIVSGTSMACPHVSGVAVLLKASYPLWSAAAIKSAIMTTAFLYDNVDKLIGCTPMGTSANPFDFGAGHILPRRAQNPGLIYDIEPDDYIDFLCGSGYDTTTLQLVTGDNTTICTKNATSPSNLNYPSIGLSRLAGKQTVFRTVTNVGPPTSIYKALVEAPKGVAVQVIPDTLTFRSFGEKITFTIEFTVEAPANNYVFGSLTWTNGRHKVRSPLVLNTLSQRT